MSGWVDDPTFKRDDGWVDDPSFVPDEKPSKISSAVRKLVSGASSGFSDEIAGGLEAAGAAAGVTGLGGPMKNIKLSDAGPTIDIDVLKTAYERARNKERESLAKDSAANPGISTTMDIVGSIASPINKLASGLSLVKGGALLGGINSLGSSESDSALGMAGDTAIGTALGAGTGFAADKLIQAAKAAPDLFKKGISKISGKQSQSASAAADATADAASSIKLGPTEIENSGHLFQKVEPKSLEELRNWTPPSGVSSDLPAKGRLNEVVGALDDLQTRPLKYHYEMLENPKAMKDLKLQFENLPTKDAQKIAQYNQTMVNESADKIKSTIDNISPSAPEKITDAGYSVLGAIKDKYNTTKDALGPMFQEMQSKASKLSKREAGDLAMGIAENSKIGPLLNITEDGKFKLLPNTSKTGVSDAEHSILSKVINDLNDGASFQEMQRMRDYLRKAIDPANPSATSELANVRSILMGQMENLASANGPDVLKTFKSYAQNEQAKEALEKIIGGKISSLDSMYAANPDNIIKKIFSNPNYASIAKNYIGEEKFNEMAASFLKDGLSKSFDPVKGFLPHEARNWLRSNEAKLRANLDPATLERLKSLADLGFYGKRFLDEVNPSGTAASLISAIQPGSFMQKIKQGEILGAATSAVGSAASAMVNQKQAQRSLNESLGGVNPSALAYMREKYGQNIGNAGKAAIGNFAGSISGEHSRKEKAQKYLEEKNRQQFLNGN